MIKYYNIPIFLPELACPYRCIYCNQFSIIGKQQMIKPEEVKYIIDNYIASFKSDERFVEVAFFGGNFTGLPVQLQNKYLNVVQTYLDKGTVHGIRCSTRPDYITLQRVKELKKYGMHNIELGAQSTNDEILRKCKRGHSYNNIINASQIILSENITLGLQMMIGLPYDNFEADIQTAKDIVTLGAKETRIYPCIVVKDTVLEKIYFSGLYKPLSISQAVEQTSILYTYFIDNQVKVLRIGLHTSNDLNGRAYVAGPYHPNFAEMVFSHIWSKKLEKIDVKSNEITINVPASQINHAIGWKGKNKKRLMEKFEKVKFKSDEIKDRERDLFNYSITLNNIIIGDSRMPKLAKKKLESFGEVLWLEPTELAYNSICTHPDIFFFCHDNKIIYAPNIPKRWLQKLKNKNISLIKGKKEIGGKYPQTALYNAVGMDNILIHNIKYSDSTILSLFESHINVNQGYTKCNLLAINERSFITSDKGIKKILENHNYDVLYINPHQIKLTGQDYGFFPGCCGIINNTLLVCGNTKKLKEKQELDKFLKDNKIKLIELYEGDLIDVGSILIVNKNNITFAS